jgi:hypothetical protein
MKSSIWPAYNVDLDTICGLPSELQTFVDSVILCVREGLRSPKASQICTAKSSRSVSTRALWASDPRASAAVLRGVAYGLVRHVQIRVETRPSSRLDLSPHHPRGLR